MDESNDIEMGEIQAIIIGEKESTYIFDSNYKNKLSSLSSNLEVDLFRISKATENIQLNKFCNYYIKPKKIFNINLNEISFRTEDYVDEIYFNGEVYTLSYKSRFISFHLYNGLTKVRFVIDSFYLQKILDEYKSPSFTVSVGRNSNVSIDDINFVFDDINIVEIFCEKKSNIMTLENFKKRIPMTIKLIKDINLNTDVYFKDDAENNVIFLDEYQTYKNAFFNFIQSRNHSTMFFLGPKGCSKSILLNMFTKLLYFRKWTKLYINMKYIKKTTDPKTIKKILYKEFLYAILEEEEINTVYNWRIFDKISINSNTNFISELIHKFIDSHELYIKKKIAVIIDNYIIENEEEQKDLENIIYFMKTKNYLKFKLIISGEGKFFRHKLKSHFLGESKDLKNEQVIFMNIKNVPKFDFIKFDENVENKMLVEENEYLNKYSFHNLFYCYNYDNKNISLEEFRKNTFFEEFPNYLNIFKKNNILIFNITSNIYRKALNDIIVFEVQEKSLRYIMEKKYFPRTAYGIAEELFIILLLKYNKFGVDNLDFHGNNFIEVKEINNLKYPSSQPMKYIIEKNQCYLITQEKYNGPNYDILIIQNIENKIRAIFVQIGVNKTITDIEKLRKDLITNIGNYKKNLNNSFGFNIDSFYLLFIFDEETQKTFGPNNKSGSKICLDNKIDFYLYSFKDSSLKYTNDLQNYNNLKNFLPENEINEKSSIKLIY